MIIIYGRKSDGDWANKDMMQVGTKKQVYAGWEPILTVNDFEKMIQKKISMEMAIELAYKNEPKKYSFYREYA